jgi:hypothetical protein
MGPAAGGHLHQTNRVLNHSTPSALLPVWTPSVWTARHPRAFPGSDSWLPSDLSQREVDPRRLLDANSEELLIC